MLEQGGANADKEVIKNSAATAYVAGEYSTVASTLAFILAIVNYPEVQRKAQAEIDRVVGTDRLPTFQDRESLPYVMAICKETLRWHTVVPEGGDIHWF
ncbi:cytochrome P450 [Schizopora paradoxa]|uniref:Cytochrome P450 n=1 Tax=Schizopora paradoxa TaxID=27342 RepID=A0A0H2S7P4_9AGAM|nr:cytochrome P450 [Schizopora paradoxa]